MQMGQPAAWVYWFASGVLVLAAIIDGRQLRVPNWLTYPFAAVGFLYSHAPGDLTILGSLSGLVLGLALLMPLYAIGGMGAGDVKLLAGLGAWVGPLAVFQAFLWTAVVGGLIALAMMVASGRFRKHWEMIGTLGREIARVKHPVLLAEAAAARKPRMTLLPYGIPIAIGSIASFAVAGGRFL